MNKIPLLDLRAQYDLIREDAIKAFDEISCATAFAQGPAAAQFEKEFADFCESAHCVSCNTGTSALHLALACLNIGPGDEVITVPMTFIATAWAIYYVGATPVFVDIDPVRRTMDPSALEAAITPKTKAIMPVHLYGQMADMGPIMEIAKRHGIPVVEDAAQAHGARYHGKRAGTFGVAAGFSFYPGKNLGALGEGGAMITQDAEMAARSARLRNHAQPVRYYHDEIGYNYRLDSIQGAMLSLKLAHLERWNQQRNQHALKYIDLLKGLPITLPTVFDDSTSAWHLFVIESDKRDHIRESLAAANIETGLHYPVPVHMQKACESLGYREGQFPHSEKLANRCLSLPMFAELTDEQIHRVADAVQAALA